MLRALMVLLLLYPFLVSAEDTVLKLYRPFGEVVNQIPPRIKNKLEGHCEGQSQIIIREDAWRCQAEGRVYDPCFARLAGNKKEVVCPQSPWTEDSVQIIVPASLNSDDHVPLDMSRVFPWAVELLNGEHCQAIEPKEVYDSMPIRYRCSNQNVLIGYLQRCKTVWSMLERTPQGVNAVEFKQAWF